MDDEKLENRTDGPKIIVGGTPKQLNDPNYQKLIKYCIEDIKKYNQTRAE